MRFRPIPTAALFLKRIKTLFTGRRLHLLVRLRIASDFPFLPGMTFMLVRMGLSEVSALFQLTENKLVFFGAVTA